MNKQKALKVVNPILAIDFLVLVCSVLFRPVISYEMYQKVHPLLGFLFFILVGTHVFLNWSWISQNYLKKANKG